jgi:hypothetical protein
MKKNEGSCSSVKEDLEFLLNQFKIERYIYLCVTLISFLLLGILICILFSEKDYSTILLMLGPTGIISFTFSRVLKMWTDCIELMKVKIISK